MPNRHLLDVAYGRAHADVIIDGGQLVNVMTGEIYPASVAIAEGRVAAVGDVEAQRGPETKIIDAEGRYLTPGLIDGHLHIECSKLSVTMFADLVSRYGTTSAISGLDQILVVAGLEGVKEFLAEAETAPMRVWWGAPAKAPYTVPESNVGHRFGVAEHEQVQHLPECVGLWETVQEFVEYGDEEVLTAMDMAERNRLQAFGCAPLVDARRVAGYAASGVALCHESYSPEEELEKLRNGINILIRESTAAPMLEENIKLVTQMGAPADRVGFCTDDVMATGILERGHLDYVVRLAIQHGVDPVTAIQMATVNTARMYRLDHQIGSITPGRFADILLVDNLEDFRPAVVIKGGEVVAREGQPVRPAQAPERSEILLNTFHLPEVTPARIAVPAEGTRARVQTIVLSTGVAFKRPGEEVELEIVEGKVQPDISQDVIYVACAERYGKTNNLPVAFIKGFGLKRGAIATSASPDDNNIVAAGTTPEDVAFAINRVAEIGGGQVVVAGGEVLAELPLPVGGIVADLPAEEMARAESHLDEVAREQLGATLESVFGQLLFLSITAIPEWAITDLGLIDCVSFEVTDPVLSAK
ncbi:adenine deaminase C-terminal domain-containing protein [Actinobaculum suis]|uniref:adenine deaminase C-terminal domain-containing protein n=1 Tax=Actinobaculum suis TaxID=1657 RepID=UPI0008088082|nr:adenine deaminase C-terminal domain-containing protein [Actinobaculum suis]OCA96024.1 adenosine deaminase [Actinobaculum suis]OCA96143.1 adenosine deaminase [Actinobaculum suis]